MSAGDHRDRVGGKLATRTLHGRAKRSEEGWPFLPDGTIPVLVDVLCEHDALGLVALLGILPLTLTEIAVCSLEGSLLQVLDSDGEVLLWAELDDEVAEPVATFLAAHPEDDRALSQLIRKTVGNEVRKRLLDAGAAWAVGVRITTQMFHDEGWDIILERFELRPDFQRALGRSRYAGSGTRRLRTTRELADAIDDARRPFFEGWAARLSPDAVDAHRRIARGHGAGAPRSGRARKARP